MSAKKQELNKRNAGNIITMEQDILKQIAAIKEKYSKPQTPAARPITFKKPRTGKKLRYMVLKGPAGGTVYAYRLNAKGQPRFGQMVVVGTKDSPISLEQIADYGRSGGLRDGRSNNR
jgi:hypothetical protein